jgi:thioredoxin-like negative regulator of GroEL
VEGVQRQVCVSTYAQLGGGAVKGGNKSDWFHQRAIGPGDPRGFAASAGGDPVETQPLGTSKPELPPLTLATVMEITDAAHLQAIVTAATTDDVAIVFDFYADWCQPCKQLTPRLARGVESQPLKPDGTKSIVLVKINVDNHPGISDELNIKSLPTVMAMRGGKLIDSFSGACSDDELATFIEKAVTAVTAPANQSPSDTTQPQSEGINIPGPSEDPEALVDRAFEILDAELIDLGDTQNKRAAAAAKLVNAALASGPQASPITKARAYAAAARCALLAHPVDLEGAQAMVTAAKGVINGNFSEPKEVSVAAGRVALVGSVTSGEHLVRSGQTSESGKDASGAPLASLPSSEQFRLELDLLEAGGTSLDTSDTGGDKSDGDQLDSARRRFAAALCLEGNASGAVTVALASVKKGNKEYGRATCVLIFNALGDHHPATVSGRRKLGNLWFS